MKEKNDDKKALNVEKKNKSKPKPATIISIVYFSILLLLVIRNVMKDSSGWGVIEQLALMFWGFIFYVIVMTIYGIKKK